MTLQFRRGTDSDRLTITPAIGEPIYTTDTKSLYIGDGSTAGGTLVTGSGGTDSATVSAIITTTFGAIDTDLIPNGDTAYDLGNASNQWRDLYLSGTSLHLGGHKIVKDGNTIKFTDSAGATINVTAGNVASSLIDSSDVTAIITAGGYTTYDSGNASGQITTAINSLIAAAPESLDTLNELAAALGDDANFAATVTAQIAALPDSAQVATIVTSYGYTTYDSGNTTGLIDSAYVQARQTAQDFAYSSLTGVPNVLDSADVALIAQANDTTRDSAFVTGIVDSSYIAARVAAGTDSATVSSIVTTTVDSAYVQLRQATVSSGATTISTFNYEADSGQTTFSGVDIDGASLTYTSGKLNVYLNGILLVDSNDYTATNGTSIVLNTAADSADTISVISYITQAVGTLDSVGVTNLIDSAYIQARQVDLQRDSGFVTGIIDSAYINARVSATDSATVSAIITADVDAAFINALTIGADSLGGQAPSYYLDYNNFTNTPTIYDSGNFTGQLAAASTSDLSEGTNLYYTTVRADSDAKAAISVTDAGGDGSLTYNSGVITYTGPSASEVRAHFTAGTGVTISSGQVSIGQAVGTSDSVTFSGLTVSGNLTVNGTTTTINTSTYAVTDPLIRLADSNETSDIVDIGFIGHYFGDGASRHTGFFRDASNSQYYIFNGLIDSAFDSTNPPNVINRGGTDFTLATLNVGTIVGQYAGFDSDVTAAGLATQTYVTNAVAALPDSAQVATIVTSYGYSTFDSTNATGLITSYGYTTYDSTNTLGLIDSAYIQARQVDLQRDSAFVTGIIDSAYIAARTSAGTDSATVATIVTTTVDSAYVQARQSTVSSGATTINTFNFEADSGQTTFSGADIDGSSLTYTAGKLNVYLNGILLVDSNDYTATNGTSVVLNTAADSADTISVISYITQSVGTLDSAGVISLIDSAYITARAGAGTDSATVSSIITADVNAAFINALTIGADSLGGQAPSYYLDYNNFSNTPTIPTAVSDLTNDTGFTTYDSANTTGMLSTYATQTYVDNAVAALPDSAQVATIVTSYGYSTYDSGNFTGQLTAATGTSVLAYDANLQGFVDAFTLPTSDGTTNQVLITNGSGTISFADQSGGLDSALITQLIDSAYVQARQTAGGGTTQQTFKTIAISGQSDVVADDSADTLTLVAGTGITLTTDAGTDTITITASGGGGGLDSAATNTLIDAKIQVLDVTDLVGADGNAGQLLKSLGNGEAEWTDLKLSDYKPTSATASGSKGEITYDSAHLYVCIATNSWRRIIWTDSSW